MKRDDYLPQSEKEWLDIGDFEIGRVDINNNSIRYAYYDGSENNDNLTVMVGGIPKDPERQINLPLINKLYGRIAILLANQGKSSLMFNHAGTGGSSGSLEIETFGTRIETLKNITEFIANKNSLSRINFIGMSSGSYIAARAHALLNKNLELNNLVLQSPAAYPIEAENIPYGDNFRDLLNSKWEIKSSPVFKNIMEASQLGARVVISYFQKDDANIPIDIQNAYFDLTTEMMNNSSDVVTYSIYGVEHNFRRIGFKPSDNIVNNESVRNTADNIIRIINDNC
ncbi:MAG: alpha/beta fold hydrolase [bacterium]